MPDTKDQYKDQLLTCQSCGREFLFTGAEQEYYDCKGFKAPPKRCKECRRAMKAGKANKKLYPAVCAACGKETRLPFEPSEDRLAYCGDCWAQMKSEK